MPQTEAKQVSAKTEREGRAENLLELRRTLAKTQRDIAETNQRIVDSRLQIDRIEAERGDLLVAARTASRDSQGRIDQLYSEKVAAERNLRDDQEVARRLAQMIESFSSQLADAEWEERRNSLKKMIQAYAESGLDREFAAAVETLKTVWNRILEREEETATAIGAFGAALREERAIVKHLRSARLDLLAWNLREILGPALNLRFSRVPRNAELEGQTRRCLDRVMDAIDEMELAS